MIKLRLDNSEIQIDTNSSEKVYTGIIKKVCFEQKGFDKVPFVILKDKIADISKIDLKYPYNILVLSAYPNNKINFIVRGSYAIALTEEGEIIC